MSSPCVPLFDLQIQHQELQEAIEAALARVVGSGQVILGPEVASLEKKIAHFCGVGHAIGCASGTDALQLALHALGVGPVDEGASRRFPLSARAGPSAGLA